MLGPGWRHVHDVDHAAVGVELRRLEHQQPLGDPGDAGQGVDVALDDDRSRHAAEDLVGHRAVQVRVVPVETGRVVGRDLVLVLEALASLDGEEDVVRVVGGGDVQSVDVEVRVARRPVLVDEHDRHGHRGAEERAVVRQPRREIIERVDQVDPQPVARANAEGRAGGGALIDGHDRRLTGERHRHGRGR